MSKVEDLRKKYPKITKTTFNRFVNADKTNTKKHLEYFLKIWKTKMDGGLGPKSINELVNLVNSFNQNIQHIELKDLYNSAYLDFYFLKQVVSDSEIIRDEKTFVREEHAVTLIETDEFLFIHPKTYRGSLKYGANTKWCTCSKNYESTFDRYYKSGLLVYLIDKTDQMLSPYNKVAFYMDYNESAYNGDLELYNSLDKLITDSLMIRNGWDEDVVFQVFSTYRYFFSKIRKNKDARDNIDRIKELFNMIDFNKLQENINILETQKNIDFIKSFKNNITEITDKLKTFKNEH